MQIIENRAEIDGTLTAVSQAPDRPGFVILTISVDQAHAVDAWPNLFAYDVGKTIDVLARNKSDAAMLPLGKVRLPVRKGGPTSIFVDDRG